MLLAYEFGKAFGPPFAGEDEIGHAAILPCRRHLRRCPGQALESGALLQAYTSPSKTQPVARQSICAREPDILTLR